MKENQWVSTKTQVSGIVILTWNVIVAISYLLFLIAELVYLHGSFLYYPNQDTFTITWRIISEISIAFFLISVLLNRKNPAFITMSLLFAAIVSLIFFAAIMLDFVLIENFIIWIILLLSISIIFVILGVLNIKHK